MSYLYYSTWIVTEHLRLWSDLSLLGCLWWCRWDRGAAPAPPKVPASVPTLPPDRRGLAPDRPPASYFERLVASAEKIVRHAFYPGKQQAVRHCMEEVEDLIAAGRITADQGAILRDILSGASPQAALRGLRDPGPPRSGRVGDRPVSNGCLGPH